MKKIVLISVFCILSLFANNTTVTVSVLPQKYFVEMIAKDKVTVNVMVKPGFSPATYEPQTSQMKQLSKSKAYFSIGVPFESAWLKKFENTNKNMLIVDTSLGINKLKMAEHDHHDENDKNEEHHDNEEHHEEHAKHEKDEHHDKHEEHDEKDEHHEEDDKHDEHKEKHTYESHGHENGLDPHVWLDPILVKIQAKHIYETLVKIDDNNAQFYTKNYHEFLKKLDLLDKELQTILSGVSKSAFMVFHPSWGYFAARYDLEQIAVEKEGKEPKPKELVELIKESKKHNIKVVFVAPQFSQKAAKTIARSIDGNIVIIDHLSYDYEKSLINTAKAIYNSYK